ncbi:MAG: glycosyltransferase [Chitinophagales bacterium]
MSESNDKILYLITATYPFGFGEPFLENELKVIAPFFEKVYVVVPVGNNAKLAPQQYSIPENAEIITLNYSLTAFDKACSVMGSFFKPQFWKELSLIKGRYHLKVNKEVLKTLWNYFAQGNAFKKALSALLIKQYHKEIYLYTYWCTQYTYAAAELSHEIADCYAVSRIHGWDCYFERSPIKYLPLRRYIFSRLKNVFAISEQGRQYLLEKVGEEFAEKISTQYLGSLRGSLKSGRPRSETLHLLSVAFVAPVKRLERIVDALKEIKDVKICWHHVGGGSGEEKLKEYAAGNLNGNPNIETRFYGNKSNAEIASLFASQTFHALINTSESEGLPVTFMEAFSYGVPIIAPNVGGIPEIVKHEQNGILLDVHAPTTEISAAITKIAVMSDQVYNSLRKNAFDTWQRRFNAQKNYTEFAAQILKH